MPDTRTRRRRPHRGLAAALGAAGLLLALTGCGLRLDTAPPAIPSPDAAETARAAAVETTTAIGDLAAAVPEPDEALGLLLADVVSASDAQAQALGGVWEPPPRPTPTPTATSTPSAAPADAEELLAALVAAAQEARTQALGAEDGDLALLLGSIEVWRTVAAHDLADLLSSDAADALVGGLDRTSLGLTTFPDAVDVVRGVDAAAYGYEMLAARAADDSADAWAARGRGLRDAAEAVALGSGLAGTAGDPREAAYDVAALTALEPWAAVAALENDLLTTWLTTSGAVPDPGRALALDAALEAALRTRSALAAQGVTGTSGLGPLPGLPA